MKRFYVVSEGQTEETFVRIVLTPHFTEQEKILTAPILITKAVRNTPRPFKGGITSYTRIRTDISNLLKQDSNAFVTTMLDYYALPSDFPGKREIPNGTPYQRCQFLEDKFAEDIGSKRFIPYLSLHEFEAILFTDPAKIASVFPNLKLTQGIEKIKAKFPSPEEIDEGPNTAPSKRLIALVPEYQKPLHGSIIAKSIGLNNIRDACRHFDSWVTKIEEL